MPIDSTTPDRRPFAPATPRGVAAIALGHAAAMPARAAIVGWDREGRPHVVRYGELAALAARYASGLDRASLPAAARVALLAPPSARIYALLLALLATGRVAVFVDGALRPRRMLAALAAARPAAIVSTPRLLRWWPLVPAIARARRWSTDGRWIGVGALDALEHYASGPLDPGRMPAAGPAIVSFTSGTTRGVPLGADRTQELLHAQHLALSDACPVSAGDICMSFFPLVTLHALCCGTTSVLPPLTLDEALADPGRIADAIASQNVSVLAAAPAVARRLADHLLASRSAVRSVRRLVVGGAAVHRRLAARLLEAFPGAEGTVMYGSTEAEPIAHVSLADVAASAGRGYLVGHPVRDADVALEPVPGLPADVGEVTVRGPHVVRSGGAAGARHRTGDLARLDERGRLWLAGRRGEEVTRDGRVVLSYDIESAIGDIDGVRAAALVAHRAAPDGEVAVVLEAGDQPAMLARVTGVLDALGLGSVPVRVLPALPVDARHFSRVDRAALRRQLARRTGR